MPLQQDPVDAFLAGIAPALKKLPPRLWHYPKADIFATVQKYELQMIENIFDFSHSSTPAYSDRPSSTGSYNQHRGENVDLSSIVLQPAQPNYSLQQFFHEYQTENNE